MFQQTVKLHTTARWLISVFNYQLNVMEYLNHQQRQNYDPQLNAIIKQVDKVYNACTWGTDGDRGRSCCLLSHCDPRHSMKVPNCCSRVLKPFPDWIPRLYLWAFSVWAWLEGIQSPASHTLHLEREWDSHVRKWIELWNDIVNCVTTHINRVS